MTFNESVKNYEEIIKETYMKKIILLFFILILTVTFTACTNRDEKESAENKLEQNQPIDSPYPVDNTVTKIEGRRQEFLDLLDNIQIELDALPVKKDSDAGITNAMRSYYGISYDMYDEALNEIYSLLKNQLSEETMEHLQREQMKWIEEKEALAYNEAAQYKGGTFEFVAYNISLYESTKARCYELVNEYMTD